MVRLLSSWHRARSKLQHELGRPPTHEEVNAILDLPKNKLRIIKRAIRVYDAAPRPNQAGSGASLNSLVTDRNAKAPDTSMIEAGDLSRSLKLLDKLNEREATILRMRFGLNEDRRTLREIGARFDLTRERVRQIESEALSKLSEKMESE
jgi:RNA polymerase primary sigma factor